MTATVFSLNRTVVLYIYAAIINSACGGVYYYTVLFHRILLLLSKTTFFHIFFTDEQRKNSACANKWPVITGRDSLCPCTANQAAVHPVDFPIMYIIKSGFFN